MRAIHSRSEQLLEERIERLAEHAERLHVVRKPVGVEASAADLVAVRLDEPEELLEGALPGFEPRDPSAARDGVDRSQVHTHVELRVLKHRAERPVVPAPARPAEGEEERLEGRDLRERRSDAGSAVGNS